MKVITLTLNTAVDQTISLHRLEPGKVNRAKSVHLNAGGKGLNVSSCLADWGIHSCATGVLGLYNAPLFKALCVQKGIENRFLVIRGASRVNIKLLDQNETTDINLPGLKVNDVVLNRIEEILFSQRNSDIAVFSGSLPEGCPDDIYARLIERLGSGLKIVLDASGEPLRKALQAKACPYCLKPNLQELCELTGETANTPEDAARMASGFMKNGLKLMVVSLGRDGAIFMNHNRILLAECSVPNICSTVGAGDAMVAGIVAAHASAGEKGENIDLEAVARLATGFAAAKLGLIGANLPGKPEVLALAQKASVRELNI